jgi:hypothetical protein
MAKAARSFSVEEFSELLLIDKHKLDEEINAQPSLFYRVSEAFAEACSVRDFMKEELGRVDAQLYANIRGDCEKAGEKVTESKIQNEIALHKKHIAHLDEYLEAKRKADVLQGLKDAFNQRSYMLRDLASLFVASYFEKESFKDPRAVDEYKTQRKRERMSEARSSRDLAAEGRRKRQ